MVQMSIGELVMDKDRKRYIFQYLFLMGIIFVCIPLIFGPFTTFGFWLNFVVAHLLFAKIVEGKEKERTERLRKKKLRDLTRGKEWQD